METEKHILCGGVKASGVSAAAPRLALNLWETHGGKNISLRIEDLNEKLWRDIPPQFQDLLELAAYVYCCDQTTVRGQYEVNSFGGQWKRRFHLHVPVRVPELWNSAAAKGLLVKTLDFLSDDFYNFSFYAAKDAPQVQQFFDFDKGAGPGGQIEEVMMFSGGLDSLAGAIEEICTNKHRVLLVNHRSTPKFSLKHQELQRLLAEKAGANVPSHMHVRISKDSALGKEYTQRARSFLYAALGATVAMMIRVKRVRFYENGIVSLNLPVCAQVVGGRATRTTHPMVLDGFQKLFTMVANEPFMVENPFVWTTKGDVVKKIDQAECGPMIPYSRSCAHTWETNNTHTHCGVCSQCIDRRFGMIAAKAERFDPVGQYKIDIFTQARPKDEDKIMGAAYLERANQVGKLKDATQLVERYPEVLRVLRYLGGTPSGAAGRVFDLYKRHAGEVNAAVDELVARHITAIRQRTLPGDCLLRTVVESGAVTSLPALPAGGEKPANGGSGGHVGTGAEVAGQIAAVAAQVPPCFIRQESTRRRAGKQDRTQVSTWRVGFRGHEVLMPPWVGTEYLIFLLRSQSSELDAGALTQVIRKSMAGGGDLSGQMANEILHGQEGYGEDGAPVGGRIGDLHERDVIWDEGQIADCLGKVEGLNEEIRQHEAAKDFSSDAYVAVKASREDQRELLTASAKQVKGKWVPKEYQKGTFQGKADVIRKHLHKVLYEHLRENCRPLFDHLNDRNTLIYGVKNRYQPKPRVEWVVQLKGGKTGM